MSFSRLDHVIYAVPDIENAHRELTDFLPEAWPIGRYWPGGIMSGVALGGLNLELRRLDEDSIRTPVGSTLAFQPSSVEGAVEAYRHCGIPATVFEKFEDDPTLLALRGFDPEACRSRQHICTNVYPDDPEFLPFEFFACSYSSFLAERLSPDNSRLRVDSPVTEILYATADPERARRLLRDLGYGGVPIQFVCHDDAPRILEIQTIAGPLPWPVQP